MGEIMGFGGGRYAGVILSLTVVFLVKSCTPQYSSQTVQLDASAVKKPYLYGPDQLTKLAKVEYSIYSRLQAYIRETREKLDVVMKWKADYKATSFKTFIPGFIDGFDELAKPEEVVAGHPLLAYHMIRRYTHELKDLLRHFNSSMTDSGQALRKSLVVLRKSLRYGWPTKEDMNDAIDSILKIQDVYGLVANEIAVGDFAGISTGISLSLNHALEIAKYASRTEKYVVALNWFRMSKKWNEKLKGDSFKANDKMIRAELAKLIENHNKNWKQHSFTPGLGQMNYFYKKLPKDLDLAEKNPQTVKQFGMNLVKGNRTQTSALIDYYAVCRGQNFQPREELHSLKCWYERKNSPELLVYPAKIEQLSVDPPVFKIHDAIWRKVARALKRLSLTTQYVEIYKPDPSSSVSKENSTVQQQVEYFKSRASANSWIPDTADSTGRLRQLSRRLESITGLHVVGETASDYFEVVAYSCGGSFIIHKDALEGAKTELRGDRIATVLFYLNNVSLGGRTAFPRIGTAVQPEAGTALLWYNLFPNGDVDERTAHAACPVVLGHKWSVNKCPTEHGNFLKHKCPLSNSPDGGLKRKLCNGML